MKRIKIYILLLVVLLVGVLMVNGQECYSSHYKTVGLLYMYTPESNGIGFEYGYTANESNTSILIGSVVHMYNPKTVTVNDKNKTEYESYSEPLTFDQYIKLGYRFSRVEYTLSSSFNVIAGYNFDKGAYAGASIKFLVPMNTSAISIEPMYISTNQFRVQATLTFIIY